MADDSAPQDPEHRLASGAVSTSSWPGPRPATQHEALAPEEVSARLEHYEVLSLLGHGGMGAVYLAMQLALDRPVAIKLLSLEISSDPSFAQRFAAEARMMAQLSHANIIAVYDSGKTSDGYLYFVMEFVDGADLRALIRQGKIEPARALAVAEQIAEALAYAHELGVIHRDIKPANVMVDGRGRVKVADFGLARLTNPALDRVQSTVTGTVLGTPDYMAPEQKRGAKVDHRVDIFSLGVTLYEMLCGEVPQGAFAPPSQRTGCDPRIDEVVMKAMRQRPEERFQSAREMLSALAAISRLAPTLPLTTATNSRRQPRVWGIVVAAVLALLLGGSYWWTHRPPSAGTAGNKRSAAQKAAVPRAPKPLPEPFINGLGMRFQPVPIAGGPSDGESVLFSIWETRRADYEGYAREERVTWQAAQFEQSPTHPAILVDCVHARRFCEWLTQKERAGGRLSAEKEYRLPTDHEWSCAVGVGFSEEAGELPFQKNGHFIDSFPWGSAWPPPAMAGNFGGEEMVIPNIKFPVIPNFRDPFPATSPVGSFPPNAFGLYDLSGNALEWCDDLYSTEPARYAQRGAAFTSSSRASLTSAARRNTRKDECSISSGFRVVLAHIRPALPPPHVPSASWQEALRNAEEIWLPRGVSVTAEGVRLSGSQMLGLPHSPLRDGALRVRSIFRGGRKDVELRVRSRGHGAGYRLTCVDAGTVELSRRMRSGANIEILRIYPLAEPLQPGAEYELELKVQGPLLSASLNGKLLGAEADPIWREGNFLVSGASSAEVLVTGVQFLELDEPGARRLRPTLNPGELGHGPIETFAGHRYQCIKGSLEWSEAKAVAESMGGHLATVTNEEEEQFIEELCLPMLWENFDMVWLGATRTADGDHWEWVTGERFNFTAWDATSPSSTDEGDWLALMRKDGVSGWNDFEKTHRLGGREFYIAGFVVEYEGSAAPGK